LFPGLWMLADRDGRLEDRPLRIKAQIFPYDNVDVEALLGELASAREITGAPAFIVRYEVGGNRFIQVLHFASHQNPHKNEKSNNFPPPPESALKPHESYEHPTAPVITGAVPDNSHTTPDESCIRNHESGIMTDEEKDPPDGGVDNSPKQTPEFKDWCAFLQNLTGSRQSWSKDLIPIWNFYLAEIPLERMIEVAKEVHARKRFKNVRYLTNPYRDRDGQEYVSILERLRLAVMEEEYQEFKRELAEEADRTRGEVTLFGESWNAEKELQRIQMRHGERSPEAREFARKWGIPLEVPACP